MVQSPTAPASTAAPLLSVRGLTTAFLRDRVWTDVIRDIDLTVERGKVLAIVGESGSGKSVTALSIIRLLQSGTSRVSGSVLLDGRELLSLSEAEMQRVRGGEIGMIFQEPMTSLNPVMTIGQQIGETLRRHRGMNANDARTEALTLLDRVRIPDAARRLDEYPHNLSGGMRQRVMIAMALACKPKLLIADEPTTALDVTIQAQILDLMRTLQAEEEMGILFITHDMGVVAEIADRTLVMYRGDVVEDRSTAEVFEKPGAAYTRMLISAVPRLGSMTGVQRPRPFPIVDMETGRPAPEIDTADTVSTATPPVLEVRGLTTRFEKRVGLLKRLAARVHAVEKVSFSIQPGETLSLVGESGCGKSTTGRSLVGLVKPQSGSIRLNGTEVVNARGRSLRHARTEAQMIFQDPFASLNPRMRVGKAIAEAYLEHGLGTPAEARARVAELLPLVGLSPEMAGRFPHEFSGGQRQRICIARALMLNPRMLIADEAVSALDVSVKAQVVNLLLDLQARLGLAYLFISHDMAVVERISHRVAVMYLGEIVEIGPRNRVFGDPQHPYTRKLLSAVPIPDPAQRDRRRALTNDEIRSPIHPPDYQPPLRTYRDLGGGHLVME